MFLWGGWLSCSGMGIRDHILKSNRHVEHELGYFGLDVWWKSAFSRTEQQYINACFALVDPPARSQAACPQSPSGFTTVAACLVALAESLTEKPEDRALAARVLSKAEERALAEDDIVGLHFVYQEAIHLHYKWRDEFRDAMDLAFAACYKQMQCAAQAAEALRDRFPGKPLPSHFGYQRTASLLEEQGALGRAAEICRQAKEQGWDGNWTWRLHCIAKRVRERGYSVTPISRSGVSEI